MVLNLHITLLSETTFGRGDGVAGLIDQEITHNPKTGLPFLRGRTLKGLLVEECANILYAANEMKSSAESDLREAAHFLFGDPGSHIQDNAKMRVGAAQLPAELREAVATTVIRDRLHKEESRKKHKWDKEAVLNSLTEIRRQTAVDNTTGIPETGSLRSMRVLLRRTMFTAQLEFATSPEADSVELALLAACAAGLRRAGTGRNRGRGRIRAVLEDEQTMTRQLANFERILGGSKA